MLSLVLAALVPGAAQPLLIRPAEPGCNEPLAFTSAYTPAELKKLGRLPPGRPILAVDKRVAGCSVTVLPERDAAGQHLMVRTPAPGHHLVPANSEPQRRLKGHR